MASIVQRSVLEARVAGIVVDDDADVVARIVPEIKKAQSDLEERAYKFMVQEATVSPDQTVVAGSRSVMAVAPPLWLAPRGDPYRLVGGSGVDASDLRLPPLQWVEVDEELRKIHRSASSHTVARDAPEFLYCIQGSTTMAIECEPTADETYTFRIYYWTRLTELTAGGSSNWWTTNLEDHLVFRAAARVLDYNRDQNEALKYELKAEAAYRAAKRTDKRRRYRKQGGRIRPRRDVHGTFQQRRM
jgi:hypothetical protein